MNDDRDQLPRHEFRQRQQEVAWRKVPACGSKGPHGARCVRDPGHGGLCCEGNGNPDPYGPKYYRWSSEGRHLSELRSILGLNPEADT